MKFTICHDTSRKTLTVPRAALQLSRLEDAERLALHVGRGCIVLTRQAPTAGERLEAIQLLHGLTLSQINRLTLDSHTVENGFLKKVPKTLRAHDGEFLELLELCGVDLYGLGALLEREGDAQ